MFCENCGRELSNEAVVCTKCGCWVVSKVRKEKVKKESDLLVRIFLMITFVLVCVSLSLYIWSICYLQIDVKWRYDTYSGSGYIWDYHRMGYECVAGFLISIFGLIMGITTYVISFSQKNNVWRMLAFFTLILAVTMFITGFGFMNEIDNLL